ncbi:MAG: hypothetical protein AAGJ55_12975, partial [Cyanobacteria bacterium J06555_12]
MERRSRSPHSRHRQQSASHRAHRRAPAPSNRQLKQRLRIAGAMLAVALVAPAVRLVQLQVVQRRFW